MMFPRLEALLNDAITCVALFTSLQSSKYE